MSAMSSSAVLAAASENKDLCWVKVGKPPKKFGDALQLFELCEVLKTKGAGDEAVLQLRAVDSGEDFERTKSQIFEANPADKNFVSDLSNLDCLNEPGILHCMRMRYCGGDVKAQGVKSLYCTFIGTICVSVNPFAPLPWSPAWENIFKIEDYINNRAKPNCLANKKLHPHPWTTADIALSTMLDKGVDQAVLICGESGSGKTEATKFVLQYLIGKAGSEIDRLEEKLMATNDPLEAFGNSKTVNNDNSSRFAKCMKICFSPSGSVVGADIQTSLLEKARVCAFFNHERNFHIFYMLCSYKHTKGASTDKGPVDNSNAKELLGDKAYAACRTVKEYDFVANGDNLLPVEDDMEWFQRVMQSFASSLGYSEEERHLMMDILVALLELGNVKFTDEDKAKVTEETKRHVVTAASLLQVDAEALTEELAREIISFAGEPVPKTLTRDKAQGARDALCRTAFNCIFLDIVKRCNLAVMGERDSARGAVGVLDIFGFERMQFNTLEQLCINYTNEKLHQVFINEVFEGEKRVYEAEGIDSGAINFTDNAMVLEMNSGCNPHDISGKSGATKKEISAKMKISTFGILDDTCKQETATDETFCERLCERWNGAKDANGPLFLKPRFGMEEFSVVHFAGPVKYGCTAVDKVHFLPRSRWERQGIANDAPIIPGFTTKNRDKVPASLMAFLDKTSSNAYFHLVLHITDGEDDGAKAKSKKGAPKTTVSKFNAEIERFFEVLLGKANPVFIRCINPKPKATKPAKTMGERYNLQRVLGQLMYTGILDTVKVRQAGFAIRKPYGEFAAQYIYPVSLLPEGSIPEGVGEDEYANTVKADEALARSICKKLLGLPEHKVPEAEVEYGNTMIFVKKLKTLQELTARKEVLMAEIIKVARATVLIQSLLQKSHEHATLERVRDSARRIETQWRGYNARKKWPAFRERMLTFKNWAEFYAQTFPLAEGYGRGLEARWRYRVPKAAAIKREREEREAAEREARRAEMERREREEREAAAKLEAERMALGHKYSLGFAARWRFRVAKAAAIESGKWDELGGNMLAGIMRQKKRQQRAERKAERTKRQAESGSAAAAMASELVAVKLAAMAERKQVHQAKLLAATDAVECAQMAVDNAPPEGKARAQKMLQRCQENLADAQANEVVAAGPKQYPQKLVTALLGVAASTAALAAEPCDDEARLEAPFKAFVSPQLTALITKAMQQVTKRRPGDPHAYVAAVLRGEEPPQEPPPEKPIGGGNYSYMAEAKLFLFVKPMLQALDKHRPLDQLAYSAAFLTTCTAD